MQHYLHEIAKYRYKYLGNTRKSKKSFVILHLFMFCPMAKKSIFEDEGILASLYLFIELLTTFTQNCISFRYQHSLLVLGVVFFYIMGTQLFKTIELLPVSTLPVSSNFVLLNKKQ